MIHRSLRIWLMFSFRLFHRCIQMRLASNPLEFTHVLLGLQEFTEVVTMQVG